MEFLREVRQHLPFAIHRIQTDNDSSFRPSVHMASLRSPHLSSAHPTGVPGSEWKGRAEPQNRRRRILWREIFPLQEGFSPQAQTLGERIQRGSAESCSRRENSCCASSRNRSAIPIRTCKGSLLTNTNIRKPRGKDTARSNFDPAKKKESFL